MHSHRISIMCLGATFAPGRQKPPAPPLMLGPADVTETPLSTVFCHFYMRFLIVQKLLQYLTVIVTQTFQTSKM
jgi:hypothetical protein